MSVHWAKSLMHSYKLSFSDGRHFVRWTRYFNAHLVAMSTYSTMHAIAYLAQWCHRLCISDNSI